MCLCDVLCNPWIVRVQKLSAADVGYLACLLVFEDDKQHEWHCFNLDELWIISYGEKGGWLDQLGDPTSIRGPRKIW